MFIGNVTVQWQESVLTRSKETQFFYYSFFLGRITGVAKLFFCVFANCLQMMKYFALGYWYKNGMCNY